MNTVDKPVEYSVLAHKLHGLSYQLVQASKSSGSLDHCYLNFVDIVPLHFAFPGIVVDCQQPMMVVEYPETLFTVD